MKLLISALLIIIVLSGCDTNKKYLFDKTIDLNGMNPISSVIVDDQIFISDSKNNRIVEINENGKIIKSYPGFKRPMHISAFQGKVFIPEYLNDSIKIIENGKTIPFELSIIPSAPGGIDVNNKLTAIADFYNHRIIIKSKNDTYTFGKKGHKVGELFYPTDVKIVNDKIVIADAYNNRVQIFSVEGKFLKAIGEKDNIKVATGVDADENKIIVTDSENSRVLIYNWEGTKIAELTQNLKYPIDVTINGDKLFVCNFHAGNIAIFQN